MNSPTLAPWLALLLSLFGAGSEAVAQNAERSFNVKEIQLSTSESYQILASGHFGLPGCGRILAVKNGTEQFFQLGVRAEPVPVTGLEHPELWEGAATVDINSDGYTDLIVHEPGSVKIRIAISNGPGRFTVYEPELPNSLKSAPKLTFKTGISDGKPAVLTQSDMHVYWLTYLAGIGLVEAGRTGVDPNRELSGLLAPVDTEPLSRPIFLATSTLHLTSLLDENPLRPIWMEFPIVRGKSDIFYGDFNGDGLTDVIASGWDFGNWWIGLNQKTFGIEYPVSGLRSFGSTIEETLIDDIDCSGQAGPVDRKIAKGVLRTAKLVPSDAISEGNSSATDARSVGPFVCTGYMPNAAAFKWSMPHLCPKHYAIISSREDRNLPLGSCCRLPFADVITDEHLSVLSGTCPENFVVTGFQLRKPSDSLVELRCSKLNIARYRLGPSAAAIHWGFGRGRAYEKRSLNKERFPEAMRHALGRLGYQKWELDGCVGTPPYGLLTAWTGNQCENQIYRAVYPAGDTGNDNGAENAINLFPDCRGEVDRFDPNAGCMPRNY